MSTILAIDPGSAQSGWVVIDADTRKPLGFGKTDNLELRERLGTAAPTAIKGDRAVIEMIASYGMAVGAEVFETCVWIGLFHAAIEVHTDVEPELVKRKEIKIHLCHSNRAKDSNITQALVDRFAPGQPNHGKGTKADPGFFYGFKTDIWQAYALAVYAADMRFEAVT